MASTERNTATAGRGPGRAIEDTKPWYRQFWPWFLIALPASVVIAGISTLFIAIEHADSLVVDDYYKKGLGINQVLAEDEAATRLGLAAEMTVDLSSRQIYVVLDNTHQSLPEQLQLRWIHPTDSAQDHTLALGKVGEERYRGEFPFAPQGRWYLQLSGELPTPWLLRSVVIIGDNPLVQLQFNADP